MFRRQITETAYMYTEKKKNRKKNQRSNSSSWQKDMHVEGFGFLYIFLGNRSFIVHVSRWSSRMYDSCLKILFSRHSCS